MLSSSTINQRQRLVEYLTKHKYITTLFARNELGILCPAARIKELRERGYTIETQKINVTTDKAVHIGVAQYLLVSIPQQ